MGKVKVSNGKETYEIDGADLPYAIKDGFKPTERIIVSNSKTKETYEIDPNDVRSALKEGFTYQNISKKPTQQPISEQPRFSIQLSTPTFKAEQLAPVTKQEGTIITEGKGVKTPKAKEFSYQKPVDELSVVKLGVDARAAQNKIKTELLGNDKEYEKRVREYRRDSYSIENLREDYKRQGFILPPQDEQKLLQQEKQKRYDLPVNPNEISDIKTGTVLNEGFTRKFIKELDRSDVQQNIYLIDKYNELANDPNGHYRTEKIKEVANRIGKGQIFYDPEKKVAIEPLGLIGSIVEGTKNKFKADEEYEFFKNAPDRSIIMELENERNNPDTDEPIKAPRGKMQEVLMHVSQMPLTPIIAGTVGTIGGTFIGNPEIGTVAATALGAYENRKEQFRSTLKQVYHELRNQGQSELQAYQGARKEADRAQEIGTIVGAAQGVIGAKIGATPFSGAYQKSIGNFLSKNGIQLGKMVLEGAAQGGLASGGELWKNVLARNAGIKRELTDNMAAQFWDNLLMTVGIGVAIKAGKGITKIDYKNVLHGLSKVDPKRINNTLQEKVTNKEITQEAANETLNRINEYKGLDLLIPENVTEDARFKIQDKIIKRKELESQLESRDKAYHPEIKEKIKAIDEEIVSLSKETEKPIKEESGLSKDKEKEAIEMAEEWVDEGILPKSFGVMDIKKDPIEFWRLIAQQAQNRDENWKPLEGPSPEQGMRDDLGDTVIDYAKELFPAPEITETITIKPEEDAIQERSAEEILQRTPEGIGEGGGERIGVEPGEQGEVPPGTRPEEEGKAPIAEKEIGAGGIPPNMFDLPFTPEAGDITRLAHADTEALYKEMGMQERIPRATKADIALEQEADNLIRGGYDFNAKADRVLDGTDKSFTDAEQVGFAKMVGALKAKLNNTPINLPEFNEIQAQIEKLSRASDLVGSEEAAAFRARRMFVLNSETLSDFLTRAKQANKDAPLTEEQTKEVKQQWDEFDAAKKDYEAKIAKLEGELAKAKAHKKVKETTSTTKKTKKTKEEYSKERKDIVAAMRADLLKVAKGGGGALSSLPGAAQLKAIAPHVLKLLKSFAEEGVVQFEDFVKKIHAEVKDYVEGISEQDVQDILAGEHTEKKQTRSQLAEQLYNVRKQAELLNKLERIKAGKQPTTEKAKRKQNQTIEAIRKQIKDLEKEQGMPDAQKLATLKSRYKKLAEEYEGKIKRGEFEQDEEMDAPPIVLDKEAQDAKDRYIEAKKKWELGIAKKEYENRSTREKVWDLTLGVLDLRRAVGTAFDFSVPLRQALPVTINPLRIAQTGRAFKQMFSQWYSGKSLDRWWFDLEQSTDYKEMIEDGVPVHSPDELRISKREEEFRTKLAEQIPVVGKGVKMSNRAASGYLNSLRVDMYRKMRKSMEDTGVTRQNNPEAYKELGKYIANMTGSGNLLSWLEGKPSKALGGIFFGARLMAAKFNLLNPYYYTKIPKEFRKTALIDLGVRVGMYTTIGALFNAAGFSVSLNPDSPDFLKVKHGKTTYDITGGEAIYVRTFLRVMNAAWQRISGTQKSSLKAAEKAGLSVTSFFRNKLAPTPSYGLDAFLGKTSWGEKFDPYDIVKIYPMWIDDIVDDWKQDKEMSILLAGIPSIFGIGVMTRTKKHKKD